MVRRDPAEQHRAVSPLELLFDLCFAVAIATAVRALDDAFSAGEVADGVLSYLVVLFAIWWAWMGATWFASAYAVEDAGYRLAVFVQIAGALVLAAGVGAAFVETDLALVFVGYAVLRLGLASQRLRAARADPVGRATMLRYVAGELGLMPLWALVVFVLPGPWVLPGFVLMAAAELAVPVWAERAGPTPWHAQHIATRYGRFTTIVIGQSVLASSLAVQAALDGHAPTREQVPVVLGGLLVLLTLWSAYFSRATAPMLTNNAVAFRWGYGHYVLFACGGAVGAGLSVAVDRVRGLTQVSDAAAAAGLAVPVIGFLLTVWLLQGGADAGRPRLTAMRALATILVLVAIPTPWPVLAMGLALAVVLGTGAVLSATSDRPVPPHPQEDRP